MRVVVPYRPGMLFRRTYEAARAWPGGCEFVALRNKNEPADSGRPTYPELLATLWEAGQSVITLEHDVVPHENSLAEIAGCRQPWCGYSYDNGGGMGWAYTNLGCTKLSAELIAGTADYGKSLRSGEVPWDKCDAHLSGIASLMGFTAHWHMPGVGHRGTRRSARNIDHPLGNEYVTLDDEGELVGETPYAPKYKPLRARSAPSAKQQETFAGERNMMHFGAGGDLGSLLRALNRDIASEVLAGIQVPESMRWIMDQ